jgi:hypothetical protein
MTFRDNIVLLIKPFDTPSRCFILVCLTMHFASRLYLQLLVP